MSIFRTPAPPKATPSDPAFTVWTRKESAANIKGERVGAPLPEKNVEHAPNAQSTGPKGQ
jgi:hypothetical protein